MWEYVFIGVVVLAAVGIIVRNLYRSVTGKDTCPCCSCDTCGICPQVEDSRQIEVSSAGELTLYAPAKLNLNLLVNSKRDDGYHSLDSIVAKITLYDMVKLRARNDGQINFQCSGLDCGPDEQNLAHRAAVLLATGRKVSGADVSLDKHIPPGSGLGGGSSDAAAVLVGLDKLWRIDLAADKLAELAAELGSDVPLFLGPAASRMTGRGERLEPVTVHDFAVVLYLPDFACPTGEVYREFGHAPQQPSRQLPLETFSAPPSKWRADLTNQLTVAACEISSRLKPAMEKFSTAAGVQAHMTGSGSAMFVLCDTPAQAQSIIARLDDQIRRCCLVARMNPW